MEKLDKIFEQTASRPGGDCPLPEPGRGAPVIEQPGLVSVKNQPKDYDYDIEDNMAEEARFKETLKKAVESGEMTDEEASSLLLSLTGVQKSGV